MLQSRSPVLPDRIGQDSSHEPPVIDSSFFLVFFHFFSATSREDFRSLIISGIFEAARINFMPRPEMVFSSMSTKEVSLYWPSESEIATRLAAKDDHVGEIPCQFLTPVRGRTCRIGVLSVQPTCWKNRLDGPDNVAG